MTGDRWDLSCRDWEQRLREGRSLVPDLPLDAAEGGRAVAIFDRLRLADVPGTPTMAEAAGDWFRDIVRALFGSLDPVTRQRRIRELLLLVPKKNSKTTYGALLMLTALLLNKRPHAPFIMTAPVQDVAELAFAAAAGAIRLDPVLDAKLHVREHVKTIVHRVTKAELQIMTFDPAVLTGQKAAGILIDELHVVAKASKAPSAIRQLRGGMLPFPEAFLAFITTQSEEAPTGVFDAELKKARAIRDGRRPGAMLPVLYEFPRAMQVAPDKPWADPKFWPMVTPNAGRSISIERLVEEAEAAQATSEAEFRAWASQHLNVEVGLALMADGWAGAEFWEQAAEPEGLTFDDLLRRCEVCVAGVDGGGLDDLLGLTIAGRERETGRWLTWSRAWAHPSVLERRKDIAEKLRDLATDGDLVLVNAIGEDVKQVAELIAKVHAAGLLPAEKAIGLDPHGIGSVLEALDAEEIPADMITGVSQGWRLTGAIQTVERKLVEGAMAHGGTRLMAWCVGNAKAESRGNAVVITKQAAGRAKIDPLMALFNAATLLALNPSAAGRSFWDVAA